MLSIWTAWNCKIQINKILVLFQWECIKLTISEDCDKFVKWFREFLMFVVKQFLHKLLDESVRFTYVKLCYTMFLGAV